MSTTSLVVEFLVIGFFPFLTLLFAILRVCNIYVIDSPKDIKDWLPIATISSTILVYILGAIFHRITQVINTNSISLLLKIGFIKNLIGQKDPTDHEKWWRDYCFVYEHASQNLIKRLEYEEGLVRIFRSTIITIPLFGFVFGNWLQNTIYSQARLVPIVISLILSFLALIAYIIQRKSMRQKFSLAISVLSKNTINKDKLAKKARER